MDPNDMLNFLLVDNIIDKYGEGSTQIHKCQTCEYEEKIYSGGTHITEGGSLMVYAEGDEFVCPNCGPSIADINDNAVGERVNVVSNNFIDRQRHEFYITILLSILYISYTFKI